MTFLFSARWKLLLHRIAFDGLAISILCWWYRHLYELSAHMHIYSRDKSILISQYSNTINCFVWSLMSFINMLHFLLGFVWLFFAYIYSKAIERNCGICCRFLHTKKEKSFDYWFLIWIYSILINQDAKCWLTNSVGSLKVVQSWKKPL